MPINKNELTKEMIQKAMECQTARRALEAGQGRGLRRHEGRGGGVYGGDGRRGVGRRDAH